MRSSSRRIVWLSDDCDVPMRAAARVKLRSSATARNPTNRQVRPAAFMNPTVISPCRIYHLIRIIHRAMLRPLNPRSRSLGRRPVTIRNRKCLNDEDPGFACTSAGARLRPSPSSVARCARTTSRWRSSIAASATRTCTGAQRLGLVRYPAVPGPRNRRPRHRDRLRGHAVQGGRSRRGRLHGRQLPAVRPVPEGRRAALPRRQHAAPIAGPTGSRGEFTHGGYSKHVVVREDFVLRVPDGLDLARAAPLLCAGITTYSPLRTWNVGPGSRVGVIGLGGLGHMAVKLAAALGAHVTVMSRTPGQGSRRARARRRRAPGLDRRTR